MKGSQKQSTQVEDIGNGPYFQEQTGPKAKIRYRERTIPPHHPHIGVFLELGVLRKQIADVRRRLARAATLSIAGDLTILHHIVATVDEILEETADRALAQAVRPYLAQIHIPDKIETALSGIEGAWIPEVEAAISDDAEV